MFYYYGAKHRLAKYYPPPAHDVIVEPFAGAAGYGLYHLAACRVERLVLVEKDPRVCELWRRLLSMTPEDVLALPVPQPGDDTADFLYMTAASSNGIGRSRRMRVTPRMPREIRRMLRRIATLLPLTRERIEILEGDFHMAPDIEATWFVDPPYQVRRDKQTSHSTGSPQGMGYARGCDAGSLDYATLGDWCQERRGQVIVAEQYPADWLPFSQYLSSTDSAGKRKTEVFWHSLQPAPQQPVLL